MRRQRRPKGTGTITARGDRWQAGYSYMETSGRRRSRWATFDTKTEARGWLTARLAEAAAGPVPDAGSLTVARYFEEWLGTLAMAQLEPTTISWYRSAVRRHIIPAMGGVKLGKVSPLHVERFLADKAGTGRLDGTGGLGASSLRRLRVTLKKGLDAAVRKGLIARNPVDLADRPRMPTVDVTLNVWTPKQAAAFLGGAASDRLSALWRLSAMTGMRRSEVCGLWWSDIDVDGLRLSVRRAVVIADGRPYVKGPKTVKSRRTVDLDEATIAVLRKWRRIQLEERLRAGTAWAGGEWVFTNEIGDPVSPDWVTSRFGELVAASGLPRLTLRQLRHTHATALLAAGVNPKIVQERLGHSSIDVTMDTYSAVLPGLQREAVDRLAALMDGAKPGR